MWCLCDRMHTTVCCLCCCCRCCFYLGCVEGTVSFDDCGQRCTCVKGRLVDCVRIRKEFTTMTPEERRRYIAVIKKASSDPQFKDRYDSLIIEHYNLFESGPDRKALQIFCVKKYVIKQSTVKNHFHRTLHALAIPQLP